MLTRMRAACSRLGVLPAIASVVLAGCGSGATDRQDPPARQEDPVAPPTTEASWSSLFVAGPIELAARDHVADHAGIGSMLIRLTNRGDRPLLLDLRSVERVVAPHAPAGVRLPLSEAQRVALGRISALTQIEAGGVLVYGVALGQACDDGAEIELGGAMVALDEERTLEIDGDGARTTLRCAALPAPAGVLWVEGHAALVGEPTAPTAFREGLPELLRAATVSSEGEVQLRAHSYDARPIERWRYDACVATGECPARQTEQPPGTLRAPAVGMTAAGVLAFCAARSLRPMTAEEVAASVEPGRPLLIDAPEGVTAAGFRCARDEADAPLAP